MDKPPPHTRTLRIVQVVENLNVGGLERIAVDLAIAQKNAGHVPFIYCVFEKGPLAEEAEAAGVTVVPFHKRLGFSWKTIREMTKRLQADKADVVHTHNSVIHHYGVMAGRMAIVPVLLNTRHGTGVLHSRRNEDVYFRAVMPFTDAIVCVCEDGREFFIQHRGVPRAKSRVIHNGTPLGAFTEQARPGFAFPRIRFGTVGRMVTAKAHTILIDAFALLLKNLPTAELHIVGDGPLLEKVNEHIERHGIAKSVNLMGPRRDVAAIGPEWDVFVLSSISEGLPVVILEAMAMGLPIVSTRIGGVPEVSPEGETAWFAKPGDAEALANAMFQAATSGELMARGAASRRVALENFSVERMCARYLETYAELA